MTDLYQQTIDTLAGCSRILITTHVRPDGDALGSTAALVLALRKLNIHSEVLLLSPLPPKYAFIYQDNHITHHDLSASDSPSSLRRSVAPAQASLPFDSLLVVDTGTWSQLPGLREHIEGWNVPKIVLDHHLTQEDWADFKLVDTTAAAAGEIVAELLDRWNIPLDAPIATALYLAVVADTGWFAFSSTRPYTMRLAARLMEAGVDTDRLYQALYQNEPPERISLHIRAMQSLELHAGARIALMRVRKTDFEQTGADVPDTEGLVNYPLQIRTVEVSALLTETASPPAGTAAGAAVGAASAAASPPPAQTPQIRVSLRSKGNIDVAAFAQQFGGGGHARAAGLKIDSPLDNARDRVLKALLHHPALAP